MSNPFNIRVSTVGLSGASGSKYLSGLLDVQSSNPANGDIIFYDINLGKYKTANISNVIPNIVKNKKTVKEITGNYAVQNTDSGGMIFANTSGNTFLFLNENIERGLTFSAICGNSLGNIILQSSGLSNLRISVTGTSVRKPFETVNFMALRTNETTTNLDWIIL